MSHRAPIPTFFIMPRNFVIIIYNTWLRDNETILLMFQIAVWSIISQNGVDKASRDYVQIFGRFKQCRQLKISSISRWFGYFKGLLALT